MLVLCDFPAPATLDLRLGSEAVVLRCPRLKPRASLHLKPQAQKIKKEHKPRPQDLDLEISSSFSRKSWGRPDLSQVLCLTYIRAPQQKHLVGGSRV